MNAILPVGLLLFATENMFCIQTDERSGIFNYEMDRIFW